jgi:hypothetical protein
MCNNWRKSARWVIQNLDMGRTCKKSKESNKKGVQGGKAHVERDGGEWEETSDCLRLISDSEWCLPLVGH